MEFYKVINERKSIRKYNVNKKIPDEVLDRILNAARIAPSACNIQPWHFMVIKDNKKKEKLKGAYRQDWFWTAPVIIVGCVDVNKAWIRGDGVSYAEVDLAIAMDHLILAATNEGLGTCWIGAFNEIKVKDILNIPDYIKVVAMTPLGFAAEEVKASPRKSINDIVHEETWQG